MPKPSRRQPGSHGQGARSPAAPAACALGSPPKKRVRAADAVRAARQPKPTAAKAINQDPAAGIDRGIGEAHDVDVGGIDGGANVGAASVAGNVSASPAPKVSYVEAGEGEAGQRIDNFLARILKDVPRSLVYRILRTGEVRVNGRRAAPAQRLVPGDRIRLPPLRRELPAEQGAHKAPSRSLREFVAAAIIHEDRDLIVVNKPPGIAVHGGSGLSFGVIEALRAAYPQLKELELVHRLDRDTSGCLLVAKRRAVLRELHALLRERHMEKRYLTLVVGRWPFGAKTIDLPLMTNQRQGGERVVRVHAAGQEAVTRFEPVQHFGKTATLLDVSLGTGRTHQIRVHAAHAGHPIAGDEKYGDREREAKIRGAGLQRMFLHAHSLSFIRAGADEPFTVTAPLPPELQSVVDRLAQR